MFGFKYCDYIVVFYVVIFVFFFLDSLGFGGYRNVI